MNIFVGFLIVTGFAIAVFIIMFPFLLDVYPKLANLYPKYQGFANPTEIWFKTHPLEGGVMIVMGVILLPLMIIGAYNVLGK